MWYCFDMPTVELPDDLRRRVVSEAAARNLRDYSRVIVDALRVYFDSEQDGRQSAVAHVRGSLNPRAAEIENRRLAELRANWRT